MASTTIKPIMGECDACDSTEQVETFRTQHGLMLCHTHYEAEQRAYTNSVVVKSVEIDSLIISKESIFTASTVPMEEIRASIYQDDSIPEDAKNKALAKVVGDRINQFRKEIFEDKIALKTKEEHVMMLQGNMQSIIGRMRETERAEYKQYDINYKPEPVKKPKSVVGKTPKSVSMTDGMSPQAMARAARDAASKFPGVNGASVQAIAMARNMSFEQAAEFLSKLL